MLISLACSKQESESIGVETEAQGELSLQLKSDDSSSLTSSGSVDEFAVEIYRYSTSGDTTLVSSWDSFASMDNPYNLATGSYRVDAMWGSNPSFGFESPYYFGSQEFALEKDQELDLDITARLANTEMVVNFDSSITNNYDDYWVEAVTEYTVENGETTPAIFSKDETRAGYFKPAVITAYVMLQPKDSQTILYYKLEDIDAQPQESYTLSLGLEPGAASLSVTIDESLNDRTHEHIVPRFDQGYDILLTLPVVSSPYHLNVECSALAVQSYVELTEAILTIDAGVAKVLDLEDSYDLVNLTDEQISQLEAAGLTVVIGDDSSRLLVWMQDMLNMLAVYSYTFNISVTDSKGESIESDFTLTII